MLLVSLDSTRGASELSDSRVKILTGILCTFDTLKHDMEIKILLGHTNEDIQTIQKFHGEMFTPTSQTRRVNESHS